MVMAAAAVATTMASPEVSRQQRYTLSGVHGSSHLDDATPLSWLLPKGDDASQCKSGGAFRHPTHYMM